MIDKIKIRKNIKISGKQLQRYCWKECIYVPNVKNRDGTYSQLPISIPFYKYRGMRRFSIIYWPESGNLNLIGRPVSFSHESNKVTNLGNIYAAGQKEMDKLFTDINLLLKDITGQDLDVLQSKPIYYEACFNMPTLYVKENITMLNLVFRDKDTKRYRNHVFEKKLDISSSVYIKTNREYQRNSKRNFVLNIYDKQRQLQDLENGIYNRGDFTIHNSDIVAAEDILRVEVQCYSILFNKTYKKKCMNYSARTLTDILDPDFSRDIIVDKIRCIYGKEIAADFYDYHAAKDKIDTSGLPEKDKQKLNDYILKFSRNQISSMKPGRISCCRKLLTSIGIHYYLIPKSMNIPYLPSILTLLDEHVSDLKERYEAASMTNDLAETDTAINSTGNFIDIPLAPQYPKEDNVVPDNIDNLYTLPQSNSKAPISLSTSTRGNL